MTDRRRRQAHEVPLGHLQRHRSRRGPVIRFHRYRASQAVSAPPAATAAGWRELGEVVAGVAIIAVLWIGVTVMILAWGTP